MGRFFFYLVLLPGAVALAYWFGARASDADQLPPANTTLEEVPLPTVVQSIQTLARLEGAQFHVERIVDLREKQSRFYGMVQAEDAILLVAVGDVVAGVDLSELVETDIQITTAQRSVSIRLPAARIFSAHLDSSRTYVHSRETDVLAQRHEELETKARARAEGTLRQAALDGGILPKAEEGVRRSVSALLLSLGFDHVEVRFAREAAASE